VVRIVTFSDGFTSSSEPTVEGGTQEDYPILNNQSSFIDFAPNVFSIDSAIYKSAFINYELERFDSGFVYLQAGSFIMSFDGTTWQLQYGSYQGDDLIVDTLVNAQDVELEFSTLSGVGSLKYKSGSMGSGYAGNLKMLITRVLV
jgi:hypothetical protein